jgi:hypothetical protein
MINSNINNAALTGINLRGEKDEIYPRFDAITSK